MTPALAPDAGGQLAKLETTTAEPKIAIDWASIKLDSEADALALWQRIAPTGDDWQAKLDAIPSDSDVARELAVALLHGDNFTCVPAAPPVACARAPIDEPSPAPAATFADPCLRRILALWAIDQLDDTDLPRIHDELRAIVALPPPESQLVAAALAQIPTTDEDGRLELFRIAWAAGQRELVNAGAGSLDEAGLVTAATKLHIDGALEVLSAEAHRAVYLGAVTDEQLRPAVRAQAMIELVATDADKLAPDVRVALVTATKSPDCWVAAAAARALGRRGDHRFVPKRPHARTAARMMRAMCVLASFELQQDAGESSLLAGYLPARGLELAKVSYDEYSEVDPDGDGDPHTEHTLDLVARDEAALPEITDLTRAFEHCTGTVCQSEEREFRFTFKPGSTGDLVLWRLEVVDRPPCNKRVIQAP